MRIPECEKRLEALCPGRKFEYYDVIDSTNTHLKELKNADADSMPPAVAAERQTAGRGRLGRSFYSEDGIYFSIPYTFTAEEKYPAFLTLSAGLAVREAVKKLTGADTLIKWPNDIYLNGKKICGILVETLVSGRNITAAAGIGINTNTEFFPDDIKSKAGSLNLKASGCDNISLAARVVNILDSLVFDKKILSADNDETDALVEILNKYSYTVGRTVEYKGKKYKAVKINRSGSLTIEDSGGERLSVFYGEVIQ